ncbi:thiol:disulfide interchange protein DsbA/DsbL [Pseudoxanthomonas dokdonensis]|uniref:Thiol:disulfide interchange protein DsbA n=1 Tax=Pseudoxanthomonas dokdonensis TaxID=344882 RepID=A0A0R0CT45_9GAMM|nr:thiol:disulfide interchange protein DsbA/DsbL [Pseudoxanthomonas dokdonensis]KRG68419.1 hypothetical protein ABB29_12990 [Pseudoxanthomonas dokdonensis]
MKTRLVVMMLALLPLFAACSGETTAPGATAPAAQTPAADVAESATPDATAAAPSDTAAPAPAAAAEAGSDAPAAPNNNPVLPPVGPEPVEGVDYEVVANGKPYAPLDGKIEVVEVFGYICPACAAFQPSVAAWHDKLPADVRMTYVPVAFGPEWEPYAKAFYAAQAKGLVDKTHNEVFKAIHLSNSLPREGQKPDPAKVAQFYAGYGVDANEFLGLMNSFGVNAQIKRGMQFAAQSGVTGTPTILVDGKYRVLGKSWEDKLRITDHLIARERAGR